MKFLVVLALAFAVSNAAFTGSLVKQTQPLLNQIKAELSSNIRARNSAEVGLKSAFTDAIQDHVEGVIAQIEATVAGLQTAGAHLAVQIQSVVDQIQAATQNLGASAQQVAASLVASIQSVLSGLFNGQSRFGHESIDSQLNALISSISMQETIHAAVISVLGDKLGEQVLGALARSNKCLWGDIWGGITDVWDDITGGVQGLASQIAGLATQVWHSAGDKFNAIKDTVTNFVAQGWNAAQTIGFPAAQQLLNQIAPYYGQLGQVAATAVSSLLAAYTGLTIPPSLIVAAGGSLAGLIG